MDKNVRIAKRLVKLAKSLVADDEQPYYFVMEGIEKEFAEEFANGDTDKASYVMFDDKVSDPTLKGCLQKAFRSLGIDFNMDNVSVTDNQIEINCLENADGEIASESEIAEWKNGKTRIWNVWYYFKVSMRMDKDCDAAFIESELNKP